jgi:hypothetical protein
MRFFILIIFFIFIQADQLITDDYVINSLFDSLDKKANPLDIKYPLVSTLPKRDISWKECANIPVIGKSNFKFYFSMH